MFREIAAAVLGGLLLMVVAAVLAGVMWVVHHIVEILAIVGLVAIAAVFAYSYIRWGIPARARKANELAEARRAYARHMEQPHHPMFAPPQQALPPTTVHNNLSLPANLSGEETIRVLREIRRG